MNNMKRILTAALFSLLGIIVAVLLFLPEQHNPASPVENTDTAAETYLQGHRQSLIQENGAGPLKLTLLDSDVETHDLFLTGEVYGVKANYDVRLTLLKYLKQKTNIKYYLSEIPYSCGQFINMYLATGDEHNLEYYFSLINGSSAAMQEEYDFWKKVYAYNQTLKKADQIIVLGIDWEHPNTAVTYMKEMLPNTTVPTSIRPLIDKLKTSDKIEDFPAFISQLQEDLTTHQKDYAGYLGDLLFDYQHICDNLSKILRANNAPENDILAGIDNTVDISNLREDSLYDNVTKLYEHYPKGKYFGSLAYLHVNKVSIPGDIIQSTLAERLNSWDSSPVQNKVLSLLCVYDNCYWYNNLRNDGKAEPYRSQFSQLDLLSNLALSKNTLFRLDGKGSPFSKTSYFLTVEDKHTTDVYDFLLLIKDSKAASPFFEKKKT